MLSPRRSLALRLALATLAGCAAVLLVLLLDAQRWTEATLRTHIEREGSNVIDAAAARIDAELARVEETPILLARLLRTARPDRAGLERGLCASVAANPTLFGAAAAFEPEAWAPGVVSFAPYCHRAGAEVRVKDLASDAYDYRSRDWYRLPRDAGRASWSEPYLDEGGGEVLMATYSVPLAGPEGVRGVVTADVALEWLQAFVSGLRVGRAGRAFLVSRAGRLVTHPDPGLAMKTTLADVARRGDPGWARVAAAMASRQRGIERTSGLSQDSPSFVVFRPLAAGGFSLAAVFPEAEALADVRQLQRRMAWRAGLGLAALALVVLLIARSVTRPLELLARAAQEIAGGRLDAPVPALASRDEVGRLAASFKEMQTALGLYIDTARRQAAADERLESELRIARQIQMSLVPKAEHMRPEQVGCEMFGLLEPARAVGGDLYDFVVRRPGDLCFVIGDVSDKGIPAALFMAVTDTQFGAAAREHEAPHAILARINDSLVAENSANMFVTLACGVLDTATGRLRLASAGHTRAVLLSRDGAPAFLEGESGTVAGIVAGLAFPERETTLRAGDTLLLYTDGVSEAHNPAQELFGEERILSALVGRSLDGPEEVARALRAAVAEFAAGAPQFDDIAILALRRPRPAPSLEIRGDAEGLARANGWLSAWCEAEAVDAEARHDLDLALDELLANVMRHGYAPGEAGPIRLRLERAGDAVRFEIRDSAPAFDPTSAPPPGPGFQDGAGGMGLVLVRRAMQRVEYARENGENRVVLERRTGRGGSGAGRGG